MKRRHITVYIVLLVFVALVLAACQDEQAAQETVEVTRIVEVEVPGECPDAEEPVCPEVEAPTCPECPEVEASPAEDIIFVERWAASGHNDTEAEAFNHWNEDDPAEIPESCARCHSTPGYIDFLGADGSEAFVVDQPAEIGTTIMCPACHNDVTLDLTSVTFPSGVEVTDIGDESRCMQCHQGRHSTVSVNQSIADAGLGPDDEDTVSEDLGFSNIHYYAAAATQYGTIAKGGYEYDGMSYDSRYDHVEGYNTCIGCHDPHTLEVKVDECQACHTDVETVEDFQNVRMPGSLVDYNGNGDEEEGIFFEIEGMREILYSLMQQYTADVTGTPIVYEAASYPYFFIDTNADGEVSADEAAFPNAYNAWTPRLAKAAYNYQVSLKDPGRFAHGGKYIIQLLYDSIASLNEAVSEPIDISMLRRIDHGHFAGSEEAFRHWDEDGMVPGRCSRCHSADGLPLFIEEGVAIAQEPSNGLACATCHNNLEEFTIREVEEVPFPSGAVLTLEEPQSNLCINCHQGRESTVSVDRRIGDLGNDDVSENLGFVNIHYFAAAATLFGNEAQGAYQYEGKDYVGRNEHVPAFNTCAECHFEHKLLVEVEECADCHEGIESAEDLRNIRMDDEDEAVDYDGDGDLTEGIAMEIETMHELLYAAIQAYAANTIGTPIVYDASAYPYFFVDTNGDGESSPDEAVRDNAYNMWTPSLVRAAYNYQYAAKDPGAFAHNGLYAMQILFDSLEELGADVSAMTRPEVPAE